MYRIKSLRFKQDEERVCQRTQHEDLIVQVDRLRVAHHTYRFILPKVDFALFGGVRRFPSFAANLDLFEGAL